MAGAGAGGEGFTYGFCFGNLVKLSTNKQIITETEVVNSKSLKN